MCLRLWINVRDVEGRLAHLQGWFGFRQRTRPLDCMHCKEGPAPVVYDDRDRCTDGARKSARRVCVLREYTHANASCKLRSGHLDRPTDVLVLLCECRTVEERRNHAAVSGGARWCDSIRAHGADDRDGSAICHSLELSWPTRICRNVPIVASIKICQIVVPTYWHTPSSVKKRPLPLGGRAFIMVPRPRVELGTPGFSDLCSTS
jgi:hypothetical protein